MAAAPLTFTLPTSTTNTTSDGPASPTLSSSTHRRVDLQSPADLTHLQNTAARAARAKIDLHLPLEAALRDNGGAGVDGLRAAVEESVRRYVEDVFEMAKRGVCVAGVEAEKVEWAREVPEEFEPYDAKLAARIQSLYARIESLNLDLSETRRTAAARAAQDFERRYVALAQEADAAADEREARARVAGAGGAEGLAEGAVAFAGREEDVARTWDAALAGLARLRTGLGESRAGAERAVEVVRFLEGS